MIYFISNNQVIKEQGVESLSNLEPLITWLSLTKNCSVDTETTGLDPRLSEILTLQIGDEDDQFIIDLRDKPNIVELKPFLQDHDILKVGANLGFDYKMLRHHYSIIMDHIFDVSRADEVIFNGIFSELHKNPEQHKRLYFKVFSLAGLCKRHLNLDITKSIRLNFVNRNNTLPFTYDEIKYMALDCVYPLAIMARQQPLIEKYGLENCVQLENEVVLPIADMEYNGIGFNPNPWTKLADKLKIILEQKFLDLDTKLLTDYKLEKYKKKYTQLYLFDDIKDPERLTNINWGSSTQVLEVLRDAMFNIENTDRRALLSHNSKPLIKTLLETKEIIKALNTYGYGFLNNIHPITHRIHPRFQQLYPDTGRVSCTRPNMQNIRRGSDYRECFIPRVGYDLCTFDFSGQELGIIAYASQDPLWIDTFNKGEDLHGLLAMRTFGISREQLKTKFPLGTANTTYRDVQKTIDFMLAYGGSAHKLADVLGISIPEAQKIIDKFFSVVPKVQKYLESTGKFAQENGYSRTLDPVNRIRWYKEFQRLPKLTDKFQRDLILGSLDRMGKNSPIQGTGADMVKMAMTKLWRWIKDNNLWKDVYINLQVHDELVFEIKKDKTEQYTKIIKQIMTDTGSIFVKNVPITVSVGIDDKWTK